MSAPGSVRSVARLAFPILAAVNLTCAHPAGSGPATSGAPASAPSSGVSDDGTVAPLPARGRPTPTTEHTELRALGKPIARHVDGGFETLVVSTGEDLRCEGERLESGADVRIQGASDPRRPWSAWFSTLPDRTGDNKGGAKGGFLVLRRPLPPRGERQIAHVYLPSVCNGAPEHFRFALPDAEPHAADPRALADWANGFARHVAGSAWGEFATARVRALYPEPTAKATAA